MDKNYVSLHTHSHFSLLDGMSSPRGIVDRAIELGMHAVGLTDHGSVSAAVQFNEYAIKKGIKPILGSELYQCQHDPTIKNSENRKRHHLIILAKNPLGVKELFKLISLTNSPDFFYYKPRIDLENLKPFGKSRNLICMSACIGGELPSSLFTDFREACRVSGNTNDIDDVKKFLRDDWARVGADIIDKFIGVFGEDNYFLEIQEEDMLIQTVVTECLRLLSQKKGIPTVSTLDSHYLRKGDAEDHRILLYSQMQTTAEKIEELKQNGGDVMQFFCGDEFYMFDYEKMLTWATEEELQRTIDIADSIDVEPLQRKPCLPAVKLKDKTSNEMLYDLCIDGAKKIFGHLTKEDKQKYWDRLKHELSVIKEAGLADYFLIVQDACQWVDKNGGVRGDGRGSGAGCLINYLLDITKIDPLKYGLIFQRFYNSGRNTADHVSLPDIDTDVNVQIRDKLLEYLKDRWGHDYVAQMITFSRLQGKAALKEVFKARKLDVISIVKKHRDPDDDSLINPFEICNEITPFIPHESEIMGDLQTIREETGDDSYGILRWTIDHVSAVIPFYEKFKPLFDQAVRLEGVKKSQSKHAAGIVISSEPINQLVPMMYDPRSKEQVIGLEMFDAEGMGCVKFDFLGVATLDKLKRVQDLVRGMGDKLEADLIDDYLEEGEEND